MSDEKIEVGRKLATPITIGVVEPRAEDEWWTREDPREGPGWSGGVGGCVPVQGAGRVDGLPWYFRARGSGWTFSVASKPDGDPVDVHVTGLDGFRTGGGIGGGDFAAGWIGTDHAWSLIEDAIAAFRGAT